MYRSKLNDLEYLRQQFNRQFENRGIELPTDVGVKGFHLIWFPDKLISTALSEATRNLINRDH